MNSEQEQESTSLPLLNKSRLGRGNDGNPKGGKPPSVALPEYRAKSALVYEAIRRAIEDGTFQPGDDLNTIELASALDVSRMPVRDAIKRLEMEGLVEMVPHKGATVATITRDHLREVVPVRVVLEGLVAREAARLCTAEDIAALERLYQEMENQVASGGDQAQLAKNAEFHRELARIARNSLLQSMSNGLAASIERYRLQTMQPARRSQQVLLEHRRLIDAIAAHDTDRAEEIVKEHIAATGRLMTGPEDAIGQPDDRYGRAR